MVSRFGPCAQHIWMVDSKGLITRKRKDGDHLPKHKQAMARVDDPPLESLKDVIAHAKPHALIGLSGAGPSWNKARWARSIYFCVKQTTNGACGQ